MLSRRSIRIKAMQYLYAYFVQRESSSKPQHQLIQALLQGCNQEVEGIKATLMHYLQVLLRWANLDEEMSSDAFEKPSFHWGKSLWIQKLKNLPMMQHWAKQYPLVWEDVDIELWWYENVRKTKAYHAFLEKPLCSMEEEILYWKKLVRQTFFSHKGMLTSASEASPAWHGHVALLVRMMDQMVFSIGLDEEKKAFEPFIIDLFTVQKEWYQRLVQAVLHREESQEKQIAAQLEHWDIDRVALLERILLHMGLAEIGELAQPKRVVINECVEIAKVYGSLSSSSFVNGVLDAMCPKD